MAMPPQLWHWCHSCNRERFSLAIRTPQKMGLAGCGQQRHKQGHGEENGRVTRNPVPLTVRARELSPSDAT